MVIYNNKGMSEEIRNVGEQREEVVISKMEITTGHREVEACKQQCGNVDDHFREATKMIGAVHVHGVALG